MHWTDFLLQFNLYLILFFLFYKILLEKETHFTLNRIYLIAAAGLSILLPFLRFDWIKEQAVSQQVYQGIDQLSEIISPPIEQASLNTPNWTTYLFFIYLIGLSYFLARFIFRLFLIKKSIEHIPPGTAFSFLNKKVIAHDVPESNIIDCHEETHINQKHSLDVLFFEILQIFTWFNPIIYAYKTAIKNIHEFLADEAAAHLKGCKESYALLILSQAFKTDVNHLTHRFYTQSQVKRRIYMLYKERSTQNAIWKYGMVVPLFALALMISASTLQTKVPHFSLEKVLDDYASRAPISEEKIQPNALPLEANKKLNVALNNADPMDGVQVEPNTEIVDLEDTALESPVKLLQGSSQPKLAMQTNMAGLSANLMQSAIKSIHPPVVEAIQLDIPPTYPGGLDKFYDFLSNSIRYPQEASEQKTQGTVYVSFIVEPDGSISNVNAIGKQLGNGLEAEAIRVLKKSKDWSPGLIAGKPTRSRYQVPIRFALPNDNFVATLPEVKTKGSIAFVLKNMIAGTQLSGIEEAWYIIDGQKADYQSFIALNPNRIERLSYLFPEDAKNQYGSSFPKGAIIVEIASE